MNMLRVWGGGIYEDDRFYDLCDEHGILVWQEFMFSCGHYPVNPDVLESVRLEAIDNVRRIRHHPCLALWCGNNEMEWGVVKWWGGTENNDERQRRYSKIFYELLPEVVDSEDKATPYWLSSPASGTPLVEPNGENEGDGHYWDVWHGRQPFTAYRRHYFRFMSEFGFESLPSVETVKTFAEPKDWNMTSRIMESHQKLEAGNAIILHYMASNFRIPKDFPMMVYVSQILQAEAIRYGVEHWRRNRNGNRCLGTVWFAPTKHLELPEVMVRVDIDELDRISLTSDKTARIRDARSPRHGRALQRQLLRPPRRQDNPHSRRKPEHKYTRGRRKADGCLTERLILNAERSV